MYVARLICSDAACARRAVADAGDVMDLVTRVCECGCGMEVIGLPDWVPDDRPPAVIAPLGAPRGLDLAA